MLLCDIELPDGSGWDFAREVRKDQPESHAIALTGHGLQADVDASAATGFVAHLTKPVTYEELAAVIHRVRAEK